MMGKVAIVYHSGYGHTKILAESVLAGVNSIEGIEGLIFSVEEAEKNFDALNSSDAIIFGSPTYMGTISTEFKKFMDSTSKIWFKQGWKDKLAAGFVNSGWPSGDKLNTLNQLSIFAAQHGMIWVSLGLIPGNLTKDPEQRFNNRLGSFLGAMAQSPFNSNEPVKCDLVSAELLGKRVAEVTKRWVKHSEDE